MNIWKYHEIKPNNKVNFIMAYNAARRSLLRLEYRLRKIYGKSLSNLERTAQNPLEIESDGRST